MNRNQFHSYQITKHIVGLPLVYSIELPGQRNMQFCALDWTLRGDPYRAPTNVAFSLEWTNRRRCVSLPVVCFYARLIAWQWLQLRMRHVLNGLQLHYCSDHRLDIDCRTRSGYHWKGFDTLLPGNVLRITSSSCLEIYSYFYYLIVIPELIIKLQNKEWVINIKNRT